MERMNVGLRGSTTPKKSGQGGSAIRSGNPNDDPGPSFGVPRLQGAGGISLRSGTPRQMTYEVGLQSHVPRSLSRSYHCTPYSGGGITRSGEGGYLDTPDKRMSPLIDSDEEDVLRRLAVSQHRIEYFPTMFQILL
jgi:hypothetical protein